MIDFKQTETQKQLNNLKNYLKSKSQKTKQKNNWAKFRFKLMQGIKSYHSRHKNGDKESSFLDKAIKAKKLEKNESICFDICSNGIYSLLEDLNYLYIHTETIPNSLFEQAEYEVCLEEFIRLKNNIMLSLLYEHNIKKEDLSQLLFLLKEELRNVSNNSILENSDDLIKIFLSLKGE